MMHMQIPYDLFYAMPVKIRNWFIKRLIKYKTPAPASIMEDTDTPLSSIFKNT